MLMPALCVVGISGKPNHHPIWVTRSDKDCSRWRPPNPNKKAAFTFIDLSAGIGGMRLAFQKQGGRCVLPAKGMHMPARPTLRTSRMVQHTSSPATSRKSMRRMFQITMSCLLASHANHFLSPACQRRMRLGGHTDFSDKTQGTLFFDVARIIAEKRPKAFLLENVKNLVGHDKGRTLSTILDVLRDELGYHVTWKVINGKHFVPQHGQRIIIVGFREDVGFNWDDLSLPDLETAPRLASILHRQDGSEPTECIHLWQAGQGYGELCSSTNCGLTCRITRPSTAKRAMASASVWLPVRTLPERFRRATTRMGRDPDLSRTRPQSTPPDTTRMRQADGVR